MNAQTYRRDCLRALADFIADASNENKLELILAFEQIEDTAQAAELLGTDLYAAIERIAVQNQHDDAFLASLLPLTQNISAE